MCVGRDSQRTIDWLTTILVACVIAHPLRAQRIDDLVVGASYSGLQVSPPSAVSDTTDGSVRSHASVAATDLPNALALSPRTALNRAPTKRCDDIGPFVTLAVLGGAVLGYGFSLVIPGVRTRDLMIPVIAITAVAVAITAAVCNH